MHDIGEGTIRRIDWTELTPVVLLLRIFNISLGLRILALALIGLGATALLGSLLMGIPSMGIGLPELVQGREPQSRFNIPVDVFSLIFHDIWQDAIRRGSISLLWFGLCGTVLIWTFCGGLICRIVAIRLTIDEAEPIDSLFFFFRKRGIGFISSLIILSLGIICCYLPVKIAVWLSTVPILDYVVAIFFPILLVFAFFTVILALGLAAGWMLLFAAVSVDGSDGFDAISRMFSYVFQRPLHYLLYWIFSSILGWLGYQLVNVLVFATAFLCWNIVPEHGGFLVSFWLDTVLVLLLPTAYLFAWFWTSSVAIYLLLRRSVDATPFNEVYRVAPLKVRFLPPIKQDEHGAPEIKS